MRQVWRTSPPAVARRQCVTVRPGCRAAVVGFTNRPVLAEREPLAFPPTVWRMVPFGFRATVALLTKRPVVADLFTCRAMSISLLSLGRCPPFSGTNTTNHTTVIPFASRTGTIWRMSIQIAVRLPDELVAYVDRAVASGRVRSRAELVARLIERDARRQRAEDDLALLVKKGAVRDAEALAIARAVSATPVAD
jgi:Arc/MetJ-type ribon-helix-helix transcriptional regulator